MKIGIFDSGFGGLEILREIIKQIPSYHYIYLADTKRAPYGNRSQKIIYKFTDQAVNFLIKENCNLIILACNTASSKALRKIQRVKKIKILGVLIPATEEAERKTKNKRIGIIATKGTVISRAFERELHKLDKNIKVFQKACPVLVSKIESGQKDCKETETYLKRVISPLISEEIDTLILGCTHYGLLEEKIKEITRNIFIVSEGKIVAKKLKNYLKRHPEIKLSKNNKLEFLTTGEKNKFESLGSVFFGKKIKAKKVNLIEKHKE